MKLCNCIRAITVAGVALAVSIAKAEAKQLTAAEILSSFNLVTNGNVTTQSDIEGSAVIGGNLYGATFFNSNAPISPSISLYGTLGNGDSGGSISYCGTIAAGPINFNGGGTQKPAPTTSLTSCTATLNQLSSTLVAFPVPAGASIVNGTFTAPAGATGLVVFDISGSTLSSALQNYQITFSGGSGVTDYIINVTGDFVESSSTSFNTAEENALFNFTTATTVSLGNWKTSVLAPLANLTIQNGYVADSVYAASFSGGGQIHNDNLYNGALPSTAPIPEVSTWAMMLVGFGLLGYAMRKRTTHIAVAYA